MTHASKNPRPFAPTAFALLITTASLASSARAQDDSAVEVAIDGRFEDWAGKNAVALASGTYLYVHFHVPSEYTLQAGTQSTYLDLDLDGKATTGKTMGEGAGALGVDLEIVFNPPSERDPKNSKSIRGGLEIRNYEDNGLFDRVGHSTIDLSFAPTIASSEYELRIGRVQSLKEPAGSRFRSSSKVRGAIRIEGGTASAPTKVFTSDVFEATLPPLGKRARFSGAIPKKPAGSLRLVSWNVEKEGPDHDPKPFANILHELDPDVIHLQEWKASDEDLVAWFSANYPSKEPWRAHTYKDLDSSIVTRLPLTAIEGDRLMPSHKVDGKAAQTVRFVAARIESPLGPLLAGSMHLKCCGGKDTYEDRLRIAQTEAIRDFAHHVLANDSSLIPLFSGDLNLVGTGEPLLNLGKGLDTDGSDLAIANASVLGEPSNYTWSDSESPFSPGRLDYALFGDNVLEVAQSFVFDGDRIDPATLKAVGLEPKDFRASDHRPLVVDLKKKTPVVKAPIPDLKPITGGELLSLATDGTADVTIVNLWATWCVPCVKELPDLLRAASEKGPKVRLILVSCDGKNDLEKAKQLLGRLGVEFQTYAKSGSDAEFIDALDREWEGTLPVTLVYDRSGKKRLTHQGQASYEEFARLASLEDEAKNR